MAAATPAAVSSNFRFKNLKETFTVDVQRAENSPFDCPFYVGFVKIGEGGELTIIIELMGVWGWGEAPIFPFVIAEDQPAAMAKAADACAFLRRMGNDIGLDFGGDWLGSSWTRVCFWLLVPLTL
ncbi:L-Ala-D/L-amino acid epimerase-like [Quillaja saponaria]|uniref:L-Ala-D/L-amino acid epimerase-like n=1 Tax=Quillaja saponaria TaxID=32244 RepID=A0AAD7M5K0_QUISA|nr:L-Ala-D/L-amino acid epimerase-like [Quillaja saponaria]